MLVSRLRIVCRQKVSCKFLVSRLFVSDYNKCKNVEFVSHLKHLASAPLPALTLGFSGLIPFTAVPAIMIQNGHFDPFMAQAQMAYGAVILSFLGGVRWGKIVTPSVSTIKPSWSQFTWSVTPSLIAWTALLLPSVSAGSVLCAAGLGLCGYLDIIQPGYESWFKGLRIALTVVAVLSLMLTLLCQQIYDEKKSEGENSV